MSLNIIWGFNLALFHDNPALYHVYAKQKDHACHHALDIHSDYYGVLHGGSLAVASLGLKS